MPSPLSEVTKMVYPVADTTERHLAESTTALPLSHLYGNACRILGSHSVPFVGQIAIAVIFPFILLPLLRKRSASQN